MLTIELPGHYVSKACEYLSQFVCRACFDVFCRWPALTMVEILISFPYHELIMKIHIHYGNAEIIIDVNELRVIG